MPKLIKILKNCSGQAIVELALILPILLLLFFGIVEFGRIFSTQLLVTSSAREAAREAVVGAGDEAVVLSAKNRASILDDARMEIYISPEEASRIRGNPVTVRIDYPVKIYAPIISEIIGAPFVVRGEVTMRVE